MNVTNRLAEIHRANFWKLIKFHGISQRELSDKIGIGRSVIRDQFSDSNRPRDPSEKTMLAITNYYQIWQGALDDRDFDPKKVFPPGVNITINLRNVDPKAAVHIKKLMQTIEALL